jgi:dihydroorotate dehydrogenase electron transfer subunit
MKIEDAVIIENRSLSAEYGLMRLKLKLLAKDFKAGQFIQMAVPGREDLILRRPMSPLRISKDKQGWQLDVLYRLSGKGTRHFAGLAAGSKINLLGPLGQGFTKPAKGRQPILIAGGCGIGPIFMLAEELGRKHQPLLFFGAKTARDVYLRDELGALPLELVVCTDDGSLGERGLVTEVFERRMAKDRYQVYACGPRPMLQAVQELAAAHGLPAELSLEERMGCGVGACLGCAVKSSGGGYRMVCKDGPVFKSDEVVL